MNKLVTNITLSVSKINKTRLQFLLMLVMLAMLVLGAGAPESFGGVSK
jgi:hypothetical protein